MDYSDKQYTENSQHIKIDMQNIEGYNKGEI